jgi:hypothetical protein
VLDPQAILVNVVMWSVVMWSEFLCTDSEVRRRGATEWGQLNLLRITDERLCSGLENRY